jgi:hypothetical protein
MPAIVTLPDDGWAQITKARCINPFLTTDTIAIADSGASDSFYLTPAAPVININPSATKVEVGDAAGTRHRSSAQADSQFNLPSRNAKIMPSFQHNLMGIGKRSATMIARSSSIKQPSPSLLKVAPCS